MLKMNGGDNNNAVPNYRIIDLKPFVLYQVNQMKNPPGAKRDVLKGLTEKGLGHYMLEVSQSHR
jgi:hypothetical protein